MNAQFRKSILAALLVSLLAASTVLVADADDQYSAWSAPVNLGPVVNNAGVEQGAAISRDGLSLYFHWSPTGRAGNDIYVSQRASVNDPWGPPQKLGFNVNTDAFNEAAPALSPDGHRLYFQSNQPGGCGGADIYVSRRHNKRDDFGWQPAVNLGCLVNTPAQEQQPCIFEDDATGVITLFFQSNRPGGIGGNDIYASELQADETFGPAALVPELSSAADDQGPEIRRDGLEMYISSNRPGTLGFNDLWVSTRPTTLDRWSTPVNLGPTVNFVGNDNHPALSFDGTALYFNSSRPENVGGLGFFDLWVAARTKLKQQE